MQTNENGRPVGTGNGREHTSRTANYPPVNASAQRARLKAYLREHGSVTTLEARTRLGIMHPAGRVLELRQQGCKIVMHMESLNGASGTRQARYQWRGEAEPTHSGQRGHERPLEAEGTRHAER